MIIHIKECIFLASLLFLTPVLCKVSPKANFLSWNDENNLKQIWTYINSKKSTSWLPTGNLISNSPKSDERVIDISTEDYFSSYSLESSSEPYVRRSLDSGYSSTPPPTRTDSYYYSPEPTYSFSLDPEPETVVITDDEILILGVRESLSTTEALMWSFGTFGVTMTLCYLNRKKIYRLKERLENQWANRRLNRDLLPQSSTHSAVRHLLMFYFI